MKVCEISGFGGREHGGYEWGVQVIRARALRFLQQNGETAHKMYKNITGIAIAEDDKAKKMDDFIFDHAELKKFGPTGAMHQYGILHAQAIFKLGHEKYLQELRESGRTDEDFFEFDENEAFPGDPASTESR